MALIKPTTTRRIELPHEPGQWIDIHPLTVKKADDVEREVRRGSEEHMDDYAGLMNEAVLLATVVAWSYEDDVTPETILSLDVPTSQYLMQQMAEAASIPLPSGSDSTTTSTE
jgi:hypothetical protein